jgi:GNAT superfamily N-acetyltransferase
MARARRKAISGGHTATEPRIRGAVRADVPAIVRLLADDALGATRERLSEPLAVSYYDAFDAIDASANDELIVAEVGGQVVGTLQITYLQHMSFGGARRAQLEGVHVAAAWRSRSVGRYLVRWAIERARQRGCRIVQLTSNKSRADAHRFYLRLGFSASHEGMKLDLGA